MNMKEAINRDIFTREYCMDCGRDGCTLYHMNEGMYQGMRFCRSCAKDVLQLYLKD